MLAVSSITFTMYLAHEYSSAANHQTVLQQAKDAACDLITTLQSQINPLDYIGSGLIFGGSPPDSPFHQAFGFLWRGFTFGPN